MLISALKGYVSSNPEPPRPPEEIEQDIQDNFSSILEDFERRKSSTQASTIPVFFKAKPKPDSLSSRVKKEARSRKEQIYRELVLSEDELRQIWFLMEEYATYQENDERRINYDGFSQVLNRCREVFGPHIDSYFKAPVFLKFERDSNGCISANQFLHYLSTRSSMYQLHMQLSAYDEGGTGSLNSLQLEEFIKSLQPEMAALQDLQPSFAQHYRRIAARKLLFFHGKNGAVAVQDLVASAVMRELLDLRGGQLQDSELIANWFSLQSTRRVYNTFLALDEDMTGVLSRSEFSAISNGTMSPFFINRIFEEHVMRQRTFQGRTTFKDEMDLVSFTDFVLAWDHRSHPAAIKYFFDIFDLKKQGFITPAELYIFFKEIHWMWVNVMGEYADLAIYDVVDEILDMIKPKEMAKISAADLATSGMSGVFFSILSDVKQFYDYNYRENFMHQEEES